MNGSPRCPRLSARMRRRPAWRSARIALAGAIAAGLLVAGVAAALLVSAGGPARPPAPNRAVLTAARRRRVVHHHPKPHVARHWVPAPNSPWQWVLDHPISLGSSSDMGTSGTTYAGGRAPAPVVYDIDGFDNSAATVNALHRLHKRVICYLSAGTWEAWRPDAGQFPAALRGNADPGWTGENWLDVGPSPYLGTLERIMGNRLAMCRAKHFDAVELDNMDVAENNSGFGISIAQDNAYVRWLASRAHALGLGVGQKNYFDQAPALVHTMDFLISEQAFQYGNYGQLTPYRHATRPSSRPSIRTRAPTRRATAGSPTPWGSTPTCSPPTWTAASG